jgi:hypothetical protein
MARASYRDGHGRTGAGAADPRRYQAQSAFSEWRALDAREIEDHLQMTIVLAINYGRCRNATFIIRQMRREKGNGPPVGIRAIHEAVKGFAREFPGNIIDSLLCKKVSASGMRRRAALPEATSRKALRIEERIRRPSTQSNCLGNSG